MARLFRLSKLDDRFETKVFTFQLPATLLKEGSPDITARDFLYGHQRWSISVKRLEKHLGAYLVLQNVSDGLSCRVDFSFTLLNSEHFTKSESYAERGCEFAIGRNLQGRNNFIGISDLISRGFKHEGGCFLLELEMRNVHNSFEQVLQVPREKGDNTSHRHPKLETNYFAFGNFDWNICVYPNGEGAESEGRQLVHLVRQTSFDHLCRVKYRVTLGQNDKKEASETMEAMFDLAGRGEPYESSQSLAFLAGSKGKLRIKLDLYTVAAISEVQLCPMNREKNRVSLYDRDKQAWMVESDVSRQFLKFRFFYVDMKNVPRKFLRCVSWGFHVVPSRGPHTRPVRAVGSPFAEYFSQTDHDDCFDVTTDIPVEELYDPESQYLDTEESKLTLHIEWYASYLLFSERYQRLDEVTSKHKHQMLREIMALQAENYALEKQLYSYQQSIAKSNARTKELEEKYREFEEKGDKKVNSFKY